MNRNTGKANEMWQMYRNQTCGNCTWICHKCTMHNFYGLKAHLIPFSNLHIKITTCTGRKGAMGYFPQLSLSTQPTLGCQLRKLICTSFLSYHWKWEALAGGDALGKAVACFRVSHDNRFLPQQPESRLRGREPGVGLVPRQLITQGSFPTDFNTVRILSSVFLSVTMKMLHISLLQRQDNKQPFTLDLTCHQGTTHMCFNATKQPSFQSSQILAWQPNLTCGSSKSLFCLSDYDLNIL